MENDKSEKRLNWYMSLPIVGKEIFWMVVVYVVVFIILIPFFTIGLVKLSLGWLIGALISLMSISLLNFIEKKQMKPIWIIVIYVGLSIVWAAILIISALCSFKPSLLNGFDMFSFWTALASSLPLLASLTINKILRKRRLNAE